MLLVTSTVFAHIALGSIWRKMFIVLAAVPPSLGHCITKAGFAFLLRHKFRDLVLL
jgi:hypothetical protein